MNKTEGIKAFSTVIVAINRLGRQEVFDGPPVFAVDKESAEKECDRLFPYARVTEEDAELQKLTDKLFNRV